MIVAEYIAKFLADHNISHIFGYQGGAVAKIIDEICRKKKTKYIQNYHEQASAFAAVGYAKANNDIGVAIATSGPGAINLIGGIADAYCDSVPSLFITGQDHLHNIKKPPRVRLNGFQDLDIVSIVKPITKYAVLIKKENEIPYELEKCYYIAKSGRRGPVLIDIPLDIQFKLLGSITPKKADYIHSTNKFELSKINQVVNLIKLSTKPVILCGGGVKAAGAEKHLSKLANRLNIPVVATANGINVSSNAIGFSGLHGNTLANLTVLNADLLLVLGARLGQRQVGKIKQQYTKAKIIHVDIDPSELGRVFNNSFQVYADLEIFFKMLNREILNTHLPNFSDWNKEINGYKEKYAKNIYCNLKSRLDPISFVENLNIIIDQNATITLDVGQNQMWVSQGIRLRDNQCLLSGTGYGSMGCSLPYAIGAHYAKGNQVISFNGDGGFQMNMQELMLISERKLNIKIIIFNNAGLGSIKEAQDRYMDGRHYGTDHRYCKCVNLQILAKAYRLRYTVIDTLSKFNKVTSIIKTPGPCIIEVMISKNAKLLNRYDDYERLDIKF